MTSPASGEELLNLNDADVLALERVLLRLREKQKTRMDVEEFCRMARDLFAEAGFRATVNVYTTDAGPDVYWFEPVVHERLHGAFDPDKMVQEVVNNVLELPDQPEGWIDTGKSLAAAERAQRDQPSHRH